MTIPERLKSRKFWFAISLAAVLALNRLVGEPLDKETQNNLMKLAFLYIGVEGAGDVAGRITH